MTKKGTSIVSTTCCGKMSPYLIFLGVWLENHIGISIIILLFLCIHVYDMFFLLNVHASSPLLTKHKQTWQHSKFNSQTVSPIVLKPTYQSIKHLCQYIHRPIAYVAWISVAIWYSLQDTRYGTRVTCLWKYNNGICITCDVI